MGYEIDLSMRGIVKGGTRPSRYNTPPGHRPGTVLAPCWVLESIKTSLKILFDFFLDLLPFLYPFWVNCVAISVTKQRKKLE